MQRNTEFLLVNNNVKIKKNFLRSVRIFYRTKKECQNHWRKVGDAPWKASTIQTSGDSGTYSQTKFLHLNCELRIIFPGCPARSAPLDGGRCSGLLLRLCCHWFTLGFVKYLCICVFVYMRIFCHRIASRYLCICCQRGTLEFLMSLYCLCLCMCLHICVACQLLDMFLNSNPSSEVGYTLVDRIRGYSLDRENNCIIEQVERYDRNNSTETTKTTFIFATLTQH